MLWNYVLGEEADHRHHPFPPEMELAFRSGNCSEGTRRG